MPSHLDFQHFYEISCLLEATARKPGNVHPAASFDDLRYEDFVQAAHVSASPIISATQFGVGKAVLDAVVATRSATGTNVNLGIILLIAPLIAVPDEIPLQTGISSVLNKTTIEDADFVYQAIREAKPGGLGKASSQDVNDKPTITLKQAMSLASDRDRIAEQYATDFQLIFAARQKLVEIIQTERDWGTAIVTLGVWILANWPDTLIARKCGWELAREATSRAASLLESGDSIINPESPKLKELDQWLRADRNRRNPGTTADLVAATLFATFRDGLVIPPSFEDAARMKSNATKSSEGEQP